MNALNMSRGPDPSIPDLDILRFFLKSGDPAFVPVEIAKELDASVATARNRMDSLAARGLLYKKKPAERTVLYWITEDGKNYYLDNTGSE